MSIAAAATDRLSEVEIDHGIPIPPRRNETIYPWQKMKVGDSFFVNGDAKRVGAVRSAAKSRMKTTKERYVTRARPGGVRVWRVA